MILHSPYFPLIYCYSYQLETSPSIIFLSFSCIINLSHYTDSSLNKHVQIHTHAHTHAPNNPAFSLISFSVPELTERMTFRFTHFFPPNNPSFAFSPLLKLLCQRPLISYRRSDPLDSSQMFFGSSFGTGFPDPVLFLNLHSPFVTSFSYPIS